MRETSLRTRDAILLLMLVVFAWGTTWPVNKAILHDITPIWSTAIRSGTGAAALLILTLLLGRFKIPARGDLPVVGSIALLHMVAFSVLTNVGMLHVPAGRSVVLAYTTPLWVGPGARLFLGEAFTTRRAAGATLGLLGLGLIFNPLTFNWTDQSAVYGNFIILLAALCWAGSILYIRAHRWIGDAFDLLFWQALLATCMLVPCAAVVEGWPHIAWYAGLVVKMLYSAVFGIALAYWAMTKVNRALPALTTSLALLGVPVFGIAFSTLILGETLDPPLLMAMVLIITGIGIGVARAPRLPSK
jgi:drug/metabolite transporter (DMT)-like permease